MRLSYKCTSYTNIGTRAYIRTRIHRAYLVNKLEALTLGDKEKEEMRGLAVTYADDGTCHVMPKKS